jgi:hypothetical protein
MSDNNALFESMLAAYRSSDDPDRFLREFLLRLDDATTNAVVATERKLDRLDAAKARLDAAREIPRPDTSADAEEAPEPDEGRAEEPAEEPPPKPKKPRAKKKPAAASDSA